jgi:LPXTG-site transpeptidase (sortase) family protein
MVDSDMQRRTRENLLYVLGEGVSRFWKPVVGIYVVILLVLGGVTIFQKVDAYLSPAVEEEAQDKIIESAQITIPKIGVGAPIMFVSSTNPDDFVEPLKNGVTHYPSALPGEKGTAIILGHSAPPGWFGNDYDGVFSNLKDLQEGDVLSVSAGGESYTYRVGPKTFLERGADIPESVMTNDTSRLLLLSCWPPGINNKRIMIQADAI